MRIRALSLILSVTFAACEGRHPQRPVVQVQLPSDGSFFGNPSAPVTIVEFGSFGCAVCAAFALEMLPAVDSLLIRRGIARFRYVDMSPRGLPAYIGRVSECTEPVGGLLKAQTWVFQSLNKGMLTPQDVLTETARRSGVKRSDLNACAKQTIGSVRRVAERRAVQELGIKVTPTFIIGRADPTGLTLGWVQVGIPPLDTLVALVHAAKLEIAKSRRP
jgi:protein-disulfide isomerase